MIPVDIAILTVAGLVLLVRVTTGVMPALLLAVMEAILPREKRIPQAPLTPPTLIFWREIPWVLVLGELVAIVAWSERTTILLTRILWLQNLLVAALAELSVTVGLTTILTMIHWRETPLVLVTRELEASVDKGLPTPVEPVLDTRIDTRIL